MKNLLTRREFLRSTAVLSSATVWASKLSIGAEAVKKGNDKRPNIIFLMSDQQRWDCIGKINPMVKTPALDKIADNGVLFNQAVCQGPMCAPKIYYDENTAQYLITWHTSQNKKLREKPEHYWAGQRTLYITSKDLKTFKEPRRLFQYDMATIDVIVRKIDGRYYAIMKDERYPSFDWTTGKTIRIASSQNLTGPWTKPSPKITPNFREAPTLIPRLDGKGWYLYYEQYPGVRYGCSTDRKPSGPWYDLYIKEYDVPENARHGSMIPISQKQYDAIMAAYGD